MARFKLYIEYDGTRYSGWQMQKNSKTVQGKLLEIAEALFKGQRVDIQGSGRTDSGVHALCQVAHLEANTMLAPEIIRMKLNDELPADISILEVEKAHPKFHARHDAQAALEYSYIIRLKYDDMIENFCFVNAYLISFCILFCMMLIHFCS